MTPPTDLPTPARPDPAEPTPADVAEARTIIERCRRRVDHDNQMAADRCTGVAACVQCVALALAATRREQREADVRVVQRLGAREDKHAQDHYECPLLALRLDRGAFAVRIVAAIRSADASGASPDEAPTEES